MRILVILCLLIPFGASETVYPPGQSVRPGILPSSWRTGGPRCVEIPDWQVHEYNEDFYILRQSGCTHYEKPFLYLIFGRDRALLVDTGAGKVDIGRVVFGVIGRWSERSKRTTALPLTVVHSHGHGDHIAGDSQFAGRPDATVIPATPGDVQKAFGIAPFPEGYGAFDVGDRVLDILAIPGHEQASIAIYDRQTGILLTGDTLYPGRLYVRDWAAYTASARRLLEFTDRRVVTHVLGAHIEQSRVPFSDYERGATFQPNEHDLALTRAHLLEWNDALQKANGTPVQVALRDFTIVPVPARMAPPRVTPRP